MLSRSLFSSLSHSRGSARLARAPPPCIHTSYLWMSSFNIATFNLEAALIHFVFESSSAERRSFGDSRRQWETKSRMSLLPSPSPKRGGLMRAINCMTLIASLKSECGGAPLTISYVMMPKLQMSALLSYTGVGCATSGAIQFGVPMSVFRLVVVLTDRAETPKSHIITLPEAVMSMLAALMSRCMIADL